MIHWLTTVLCLTTQVTWQHKTCKGNAYALWFCFGCFQFSAWTWVFYGGTRWVGLTITNYIGIGDTFEVDISIGNRRYFYKVSLTSLIFKCPMAKINWATLRQLQSNEKTLPPWKTLISTTSGWLTSFISGLLTSLTVVSNWIWGHLGGGWCCWRSGHRHVNCQIDEVQIALFLALFRPLSYDRNLKIDSSST